MKPKEKILKRLAGCEFCRKSCGFNSQAAAETGKEGVLFGCNTSHTNALYSHWKTQKFAKKARLGINLIAR